MVLICLYDMNEILRFILIIILFLLCFSLSILIREAIYSWFEIWHDKQHLKRK